MLNRVNGAGLLSLLVKGHAGRFPPGRSLQPLPGGDTVRLSQPGLELAVSRAATVARARSTALSAYQPSSAMPPLPTQDTSMLDRFRAAMFTSSDHERFDVGLDLNNDGVINFADLKAFKNAQSEPQSVAPPTDSESPVVPDPVDVVERMRAAFFSVTGDDHFDPGSDLNGDGQVNYADLAILRAGDDAVEPDSTPDMLAQMRDAFFTQRGDDGYESALDLNNDGSINYADLAALRDQQSNDESATTGLSDNLSAALPQDPHQATFTPIHESLGFAGGPTVAGSEKRGDGFTDFYELPVLRAPLD